MQNNWLLEHETFGCVLTLEMFIRYFSYEIMLSSGLIKLFYNTVMPCAAVLLQPTNNYIFMLCKVNLYASDNLIWNSKPVYSRLKLFGYIWDLTIQTSCYHITGRAFKCYSHEHKGFALDTQVREFPFKSDSDFHTSTPLFLLLESSTSEKKHGMGGESKWWILINEWARVVSTNNSFSTVIFSKKPSYGCNSFH